MKGLDKWLTTNPNDQDDSFFEAVVESYNDKFYDEQEDKFVYSDEETDLINKCISKGYSPKESALIIERLHKLYKL
jgi:hypothetical protein